MGCIITGLSIMREMYDEFFPDNKLIMDQRLPKSLLKLFQICGRLYVGKSQPKFTEWVKEFVLERLDATPCKNLASSLVDFEDWGIYSHLQY